MRVKGKGAKQDENRHRGAIVLDGNVLQVFVFGYLIIVSSELKNISIN